MYKAITFFFILSIFIGIMVIVVPIKEKDYELYNDLLKSSSSECEASLLNSSQHKRTGVSKQIWYQDSTSLYFRIDSNESELFFFRQNNGVEVIEQLGKVSCVMQEELYFDEGRPMQRIRYLEAERASYNYNTHRFVAEDVKLWKYRLDGHEPPVQIQHNHPLMHATAQSIEFTLNGDKLKFLAHQMKATINGHQKERAL